MKKLAMTSFDILGLTFRKGDSDPSANPLARLCPPANIT